MRQTTQIRHFQNRFLLRSFLRSLPLFGAFAFVVLASFVARSDENCPQGQSSILSQAKDLCQVKCAAEVEKTGTGTLASDPSCRSTESVIHQDWSTRIVDSAVGCAAGLGGAFFQAASELLNADQLKEFRARCDKNVDCRRELARNLEAFRGYQRDANGKVILDPKTNQPIPSVSDTQVDQAVAQTNIDDLQRRSAKNADATVHGCQAELTTITAKQGDAFADANAKDDQAALLKLVQERYTRIRDYDPDCPKLLHLAEPKELPKAPDLRQTAAKSLGKTRAIGKEFEYQVEKFLTDRNVALTCYDSETAAKLQCYAVTYVTLQTIGVPGGEAILAKIAALTGKAKDAIKTIIAEKKLSRDAEVAGRAGAEAKANSLVDSYTAKEVDPNRSPEFQKSVDLNRAAIAKQDAVVRKLAKKFKSNPDDPVLLEKIETETKALADKQKELMDSLGLPGNEVQFIEAFSYADGSKQPAHYALRSTAGKGKFTANQSLQKFVETSGARLNVEVDPLALEIREAGGLSLTGSKIILPEVITTQQKIESGHATLHEVDHAIRGLLEKDNLARAKHPNGMTEKQVDLANKSEKELTAEIFEAAHKNHYTNESRDFMVDRAIHLRRESIQMQKDLEGLGPRAKESKFSGAIVATEDKRLNYGKLYNKRFSIDEIHTYGRDISQNISKRQHAEFISKTLGSDQVPSSLRYLENEKKSLSTFRDSAETTKSYLADVRDSLIDRSDGNFDRWKTKKGEYFSISPTGSTVSVSIPVHGSTGERIGTFEAVYPTPQKHLSYKELLQFVDQKVANQQKAIDAVLDGVNRRAEQGNQLLERYNREASQIAKIPTKVAGPSPAVVSSGSPGADRLSVGSRAIVAINSSDSNQPNASPRIADATISNITEPNRIEFSETVQNQTHHFTAEPSAVKIQIRQIAPRQTVQRQASRVPPRKKSPATRGTASKVTQKKSKHAKPKKTSDGSYDY